MRGEETQVLGALAALPATGGLVCLPGTHSKWVRVEDGALQGFATYMTGEVFDLLQGHSILSRLRSEEHTSELQSLMRISYAVFCLKKKQQSSTLYPTSTR